MRLPPVSTSAAYPQSRCIVASRPKASYKTVSRDAWEFEDPPSCFGTLLLAHPARRSGGAARAVVRMSLRFIYALLRSRVVIGEIRDDRGAPRSGPNCRPQRAVDALLRSRVASNARHPPVSSRTATGEIGLLAHRIDRSVRASEHRVLKVASSVFKRFQCGRLAMPVNLRSTPSDARAIYPVDDLNAARRTAARAPR